ncbi:MAG: hypothetical protein M1838_001379 [Thelocarpon superellum]|nr:MAG: hypothetical protein M1838_001379 [Thelocarpon superellum]
MFSEDEQTGLPETLPTTTGLVDLESPLRPHRLSSPSPLGTMSEPIPESIPTSRDARSQRPTKKQALTPSSAQASQLNALFARPEREIIIPPSATRDGLPKTLAAPPEIVANVQGSSAGAGSGEFHVYKASRRREYERLRLMDEEVKKEKEAHEFERRREELKSRDEAKTSRNKARREKLKARKLKKGAGGEGGGRGRGGGSGGRGDAAGGDDGEEGGASDGADAAVAGVNPSALAGGVDASNGHAADATVPLAPERGVVIHDDD